MGENLNAAVMTFGLDPDSDLGAKLESVYFEAWGIEPGRRRRGIRRWNTKRS